MRRSPTPVFPTSVRRRQGIQPHTTTRLVLAGLVIGTLVTMVTAWTGGPIGHPEIRP